MLKYYVRTGEDAVISTERATVGKLNFAVIDAINCLVKMDKYKRMMSRYESWMEVWKDKNAKGYALVLQHCLREW